MFLVDQDDIVAVHRAHEIGGRDAALAEVRRRWPALADRALPGVLDRVLALKVDVPVRVLQHDEAVAEAERRRIRELEVQRLRRARIKAERDGPR